MLNVRTRPPVNSIRTAALAATVLALVAVLSLHVPGASAHARYDHSTPGNGEVLATAPAKVDVFFAEEVQRANGLPTLFVVDDNGDSVDKGSVLDDSDRTHISDELNPDLPDGRYTVIWHTVSADDGEEAQGAFHFYVGSAPTQVPSGSAASSTAKATGTPVASTPPATNNDSDDDIPIWGLIVGIIGGAVVGGIAGAVIGRRSSS
jgi:methionine-rich copper-binding protein CopC